MASLELSGLSLPFCTMGTMLSGHPLFQACWMLVDVGDPCLDRLRPRSFSLHCFPTSSSSLGFSWLQQQFVNTRVFSGHLHAFRSFCLASPASQTGEQFLQGWSWWPLWHISLETIKLKQVDGASLEISEESSNWTVCVTHRK